MAGDGENDNAGGLITVTIYGSGPYGFRLSGGDGVPMVVTKMRRQGKGYQAGLKEGDIVVGINGFNGRSMSHAAAMGLLESAVQSIELTVYRGPADQVNAAFGEAETLFRPLPPGAAPPPRVLPPPPSTESGEMVIDQPAFTRSAAEKFVVDVNAGQHHLTNGGSTGNQVMWKPSAAGHRNGASNGPRPMSALPLAGRGHNDEFLLAAPAAPLRAPSPIERPRTVAAQAGPDYATGTWPGPVRREPLNQESVNFQVKRPNGKPWVWQPSVMYEIHTDVKSEPIEWQPLPDLAVSADDTNGRGGNHKDQPDGGSNANRNDAGNRGDDPSIPKWALPLRSDYDWKKSYPWAEDGNTGQEDEWEYAYASNGELIKRKKKVFADSSFYDDPQHKYPTIEEQIKMARRVAQSLTSAGNVTARGQRMFLRRREKADRWVVSDIPTPGLASYIRHGGGQGIVRQPHHDEDETDAELYYNPTPWAKSRPQQQQQPAAAAPPAPAVRTPFTGGRLPWKTDFDPSSVAASALRPPSPPPLPAPGTSFNHHGQQQQQQQPKWQPLKETGGSGAVKAPPKGASGAGAGAAFSLAKELRGLKGRGGKMFAKRRAQAAEDERREELAETLRSRSTPNVSGGYDDDWTDSAAVGSAEAEASGESPQWNRELPPSYGQPVRLLELIEKTRASSPGRRWTQQTPSVMTVSDSVKDPSSYGNFSIDYSIKSRGTFRPVRFQTPGGAKSVAPPMAEDDYSMPAGIPVSDF